MVFTHLSILWIMMFYKISIYVVECVNILNLCSSLDEFMVTYSPYKRLWVVWEVTNCSSSMTILCFIIHAFITEHFKFPLFSWVLDYGQMCLKHTKRSLHIFSCNQDGKVLLNAISPSLWFQVVKPRLHETVLCKLCRKLFRILQKHWWPPNYHIFLRH